MNICPNLLHYLCVLMLQVKNIGHGNVANSTVTIFWPYEVQSKDDQGKHLLYMIEEPVVSI